MNYNFIMTHSMYPLKERKKILDNYYFDNPRTGYEIKAVAKVLRTANFIDSSPFPETYNQVGKDYISLEWMLDEFFDKYKLDKRSLLKDNGEEYKNVYYKMAKNWVILRYSVDALNEDVGEQLVKTNDNINTQVLNYYDNDFDRYENAVKYINLLTFLTFPNNTYKKHSFIIPECFDYFEISRVDKTIKNIIINLLVLGTSKGEKDQLNDFRFCSFNNVYLQLKETEKLFDKFMQNTLIEYIADNINNYISITDNKMRIISLVSIFELLLTHNPNFNRYNVEDSIRKQFATKLTMILYLNDNTINYKEIEKYLLLVYDLRSAIAHGSFDKVEEITRKIDLWLLKNNSEYKRYYEEKGGFDLDDTLEEIDESLKIYLRIVIKSYLKDKNLFEILKK